MKNDPEIVKILREEERCGKLQSLSLSTPFQERSIHTEKEHRMSSKITTEQQSMDGPKRSILDLIDTQEKYDTIFQNYSVAITLADNEEHIVSWNKYTEELLNMQEQDLYMKPVSSLYPTDEWQKIRKENIRKKGIRYRMETQMLRKNHELLDVDISLSILKGFGGEVVGSVGIIRDITELKKAEKDLKDSEQRYRTIFDNSAVAITLTDENEKIIQWNKCAEMLFGMNKDDLYLKPVRELYPDAEWQKIRAQNIRQKGMQHHLETKIQRKSHEQLDVDLSLSVLKNHEEKVIGSIGVIKDINEKKRAERTLKESEERYRTIFDNSAVAITLSDENEKIISWNKYAEMLFGMNKDDLYLKPVRELYPDAEWQKIRAQNIRQKGMHYHLETKIQRKTHEQLDVDLSLSVLKNHEDKIVGSIGVIKDISEKKRAEKTLESSEKKFKLLYEKAPVPYHTLSTSGIVTDVNEKWCQAFGYTKEEVCGKSIFEFISENERTQAQQSFTQKILEGKSYNGGHEREYRTKTGERRLFITHDFFMFDENGKVTSVYTTMEDITENKKTEQMLKEKINELERYKTITVNREIKMVELKKEINELYKKLQMTQKY